MPIKVAIVEDDPRIRRSLASMLATANDVQCTLECSTGEEALEQIPGAGIDVVFMDIHLPGMSGVDCVQQLTLLTDAPQVVMLTCYNDTENLFASLKAGARGYLLKPVRTNQLVAAARDVHLGGAPMTSQIARRVVEFFNAPQMPPSTAAQEHGLSERELEVLQKLCRGMLYKEISQEMQVGYSTVRTYVERIYNKLHVRSRSQAVAKMQILGLG